MKLKKLGTLLIAVSLMGAGSVNARILGENPELGVQIDELTGIVRSGNLSADQYINLYHADLVDQIRFKEMILSALLKRLEKLDSEKSEDIFHALAGAGLGTVGFGLAGVAVNTPLGAPLGALAAVSYIYTLVRGNMGWEKEKYSRELRWRIMDERRKIFLLKEELRNMGYEIDDPESELPALPPLTP